MSPNSLANLRTWKKGESGNPEGRPPGGPLVTPALRRFANLKVKDFWRLDIPELTMAEATAAGIFTLALQSEGGRERSAVLDRLDGALAKPTEGDDNRIQILVLEYDGIAVDRIG